MTQNTIEQVVKYKEKLYIIMDIWKLKCILLVSHLQHVRDNTPSTPA